MEYPKGFSIEQLRELNKDLPEIIAAMIEGRVDALAIAVCLRDEFGPGQNAQRLVWAIEKDVDWAMLIGNVEMLKTRIVEAWLDDCDD